VYECCWPEKVDGNCAVKIVRNLDHVYDANLLNEASVLKKLDGLDGYAPKLLYHHKPATSAQQDDDISSVDVPYLVLDAIGIPLANYLWGTGVVDTEVADAEDADEEAGGAHLMSADELNNLRHAQAPAAVQKKARQIFQHAKIALTLAADRHQIIHVDFRPSNLLVNASSKLPLIVDWGSALPVGAVPKCIVGVDAFLPDVILGSPTDSTLVKGLRAHNSPQETQGSYVQVS
jgi:serine/threonine protein kinase